jgi:biopolymer transport protein ExbB
MTAGKDWGEWLRSGGVLLWPILATGIIGLLIVLERMLFFLRIGREPDGLMARFYQSAEQENWQECDALMNQAGETPVVRVMKKVLAGQEHRQEVLEATLQEAMLVEIPRLERFLSILRVLTVISPLLGLLGTVTGMINTFQVITVFGTGEPRLMAGGISEALITTQAGLAVAIPLILAGHCIRTRVMAVVDEMDGQGSGLIALLLRSQNQK